MSATVAQALVQDWLSRSEDPLFSEEILEAGRRYLREYGPCPPKRAV